MYVANVEADLRSAVPGAARGNAGGGDFFAELLRRHTDVNEPAPQPKDEPRRPAAEPERERGAAASERKPEQPVDAEAAAPATAEPTPDSAGDVDPAAPAEATAGAPDTATDHDDQDPTSAATAALPMAEPIVTPPASIVITAGEAPTAATVSATPIAPADAVAASASLDAIAPDAPGSAQAPAAPAPAPTADEAVAAAAPKTEPSSVPAPAHPARPANAAEPVIGDPAAPEEQPQTITAFDTASDAGTADVTVEAKRSPAATPAQGLGKLGSGAEVALAAQAIGEAMRAANAPAGKPQSAAPAQPFVAAFGQDGETASAPAGIAVRPQAATPAAATAGSQPSATTAQPGGGESAQSFDALLAMATPGEPADAGATAGTVTDAGLRIGATAAKAAGAPTHAGAAYAAPAEQVALQVQRAVRDGGSSRITVQLNPAELGQVEVKLDFGRDGSVSATVLADRVDTLDMLQRDARVLERALQDAGLKADSNSLSFDLRDGGRNGAGSHQNAGGFRDGTAAQSRAERPAVADAAAAQSMTTGTADGGVDIRV